MHIEGLVLPNDEESRKRLMVCIDEIVNSQIRVNAEKDFQKEAIKLLVDTINIDKKVIKKYVKWKLKGDGEVAEVSDAHAGFELLYNGGNVEEDDSSILDTESYLFMEGSNE